MHYLKTDGCLPIIFSLTLLHTPAPFSSLNPHHPIAFSMLAYNSVEHPQPLRIIPSSLHTICRRAVIRDVWDGNGATESIRWVIYETDRRRKMQMQYNEEHGITPEPIVKAIQKKIVPGQVEDEKKLVAAVEGLERARGLGIGWRR